MRAVDEWRNSYFLTGINGDRLIIFQYLIIIFKNGENFWFCIIVLFLSCTMKVCHTN